MAANPSKLAGLEAVIEPLLLSSRIPGIALAVVVRGEIVLARGFGFRDYAARLPMTGDTAYPIASTTKALNATLLGMLVEEGHLQWDVPVQDYAPQFRLGDPLISAQVTLRDLVLMRSGLPRHDWVWIDAKGTRADLIARLRYLEFSAGFRERFQYNNLSVTAAGHIAEVVTGRSWEELIRQKLLVPLAMYSTGFSAPHGGEATLAYRENSRRELTVTRRLGSELTAPSGGAIHSTVLDMARWMAFNLDGGKVAGQQLIHPQTLRQLHSAQIPVAPDPSAPTADARYAMGWFVDSYRGCARLSHGGYLHDVSSEVMLFPNIALGIVTCINFGCVGLTRCIAQHVFDAIMGFEPPQGFAEKLAQYECKIAEVSARNRGAPRVEHTSPSHPLDAYVGSYVHPGYGSIDIELRGQDLVFIRRSLVLPLRHWHYDVWVSQESDMFLLHVPHVLDACSRLVFESNADGNIIALLVQLEPVLAPIRFCRAQPA